MKWKVSKNFRVLCKDTHCGGWIFMNESQREFGWTKCPKCQRRIRYNKGAPK